MKNFLSPIKYALLPFFLFIPILVQAETYIFHLKYDEHSKTISFAEKKSTLSKDDFTENIDELAQRIGSYNIVFFKPDNSELIRYEFEKQSGNFDLKFPYYSAAKYLKIYEKKSNKEVLHLDLTKSLACNHNKVCEFEKGENFSTCIPDCVSTNTNFSKQTLSILKKNKGEIRDPDTGEILLKISDEYAKKLSFTNKYLLHPLAIAAFLVVIFSIIIYFILKSSSNN